MKMIKKVAAVVMAALTASSAFAADELYNATAGAVDNNSAYLLDVIQWSKMDFAQAYGLVSLESEEYGNLAGAYKLNNGATVHGYWSGTLWEEDAYNTFAALYGKDKMAFAGQFTKIDESYFGLTSAVKILSGSFGMQYNEKLAFAAGLGYGWSEVAGEDMSLFNVNGEIQYSLNGSSSSGSSSKRSRAKKTEEKPAASSSNGNESIAGVTVDFTKFSISDADMSGSTFTLTPNYKLQYKFSDSVKYGFKAAVPVTFYGGDFDADTSVEFVLKNGITAKVSPKVTFAAGIQTILPTVYFGDNDTPNGDYSNSFYLGCGIDVTPNVQLAVSANIKPTEDDDSGSNGESLNEIWEQGFAISVSFKL